jgi:hypothetical protein
MELKYLNRDQKRKVVEFLTNYDTPKLTETKHFTDYSIRDISEENYTELYQNIIDDHAYLKSNYEDSLDYINKLENKICELFYIIEYLVNNKGDIQEIDIDEIIPDIKAVFKEDEINQLERNVKLDELVKNFTN